MEDKEKTDMEKISENKTKETMSNNKGENKVLNNAQSSFLKKWGFIIIIIVILLIGTVAILLKTKKTVQNKPMVRRKTIIKQVLVKRSKDPLLVSRALTGKAVDVNTGKIVAAARIFSTDDKNVYLELDLVSAAVGTVIDYIRYKDGRFINHGEITITRTNANYVLFNWSINKLLANVMSGKWKVATYTNGILAKRVVYQVQNNKISYIYPDKRISPKDPEYNLHKTLSAVMKGN